MDLAIFRTPLEQFGAHTLLTKIPNYRTNFVIQNIVRESIFLFIIIYYILLYLYIYIYIYIYIYEKTTISAKKKFLAGSAKILSVGHVSHVLPPPCCCRARRALAGCRTPLALYTLQTTRRHYLVVFSTIKSRKRKCLIAESISLFFRFLWKIIKY